MKKYIQPQIEINKVGLLLLLSISNSEGSDDPEHEFGNSSFFDDEQASVPSSKSLWDD